MTKSVALNKIVAVEKGVKSRTKKEFSKLHHELDKVALRTGLERKYEPAEDSGKQLPGERQLVQLYVQDKIDEAQSTLTRLFDVVATKDYGNCIATADVVVEDTVLLEDVPVTYLLFLEKQLRDIRTFISELPVLDPSEEWRWDENKRLYVTSPIKTVREEKAPRAIVKYDATEFHPAQTEIFHDTVVAGTWTLRKMSSALPATRTKELQERVNLMLDAVKIAREGANATEVMQVKVGERVMDWLFAE